MSHVRELRDRFIAGPIRTAEKLGERSIQGRARFIDVNTLEVNGERIAAETVIIATGTRPILPAPWRALGERVVTSDNVFDLVAPRSEEHTSELQSRPHLVCRLLLEKKKNTEIN